MTLGVNSGLWISDNGAGVVTNATPGFVIGAGGSSAPSVELFATEDGTIAGWNSTVDPTHAVIVVDNSGKGAVYKGLAMGFNEDGAFLVWQTARRTRSISRPGSTTSTMGSSAS